MEILYSILTAEWLPLHLFYYYATQRVALVKQKVLIRRRVFLCVSQIDNDVLDVLESASDECRSTDKCYV